ncbi:MAG TPA: hypothetical protein PKM88_13335 [bacterium]|nr:hypothetical protein [bacterium]
MKNMVLAALMVAVLALPAAAGTVGGPAIDGGTLEVGYDMAYMDRHYDFTGNSNGVSNLGYDNASLRRLSHLGVISYGLTDMIEAKVTLGADKLNALEDETQTAIDFSSNRTHIADRPSFMWGGGLKLTVPSVFANVDITLAGQYQQVKFKNADFSDAANDNPDYFDGDVKSCSWQADLLFSMEYEQFTPYLGLQYSDDKIDVEYRSKNNAQFGPSFTSEYEASHNWGVVVGSEIDFTGVIGAYVEGRFVDEGAAFSAGLTYRF